MSDGGCLCNLWVNITHVCGGMTKLAAHMHKQGKKTLALHMLSFLPSILFNVA